MPKKIELTKLGEKQYAYLTKKGVKITRREFKDYYESVRKVNRKIGSKNFKEAALKANLYTTSVKRIKNRKDFLKNRRNFKNVLSPDYRKRINEEMRGRLYYNLQRDLGVTNASKIIDILKNMTDRELIEFFKVNSDLESLLYDSDNPITEYIDITVEKFMNRLNTFKKEYANIEKINELKQKALHQDYRNKAKRKRIKI